MVVRNISEKLDEVVINFKKQIELQVGREISYKLASKLYANVIQKNIYIKSSTIEKNKQKKDRKIIFSIEMKDEK